MSDTQFVLPTEYATVSMETYNDLRLRFGRVEASRDDYKQQLGTSVTRHAEDIRRIGEALMSEADFRQWCDLYDDFVDKLNDSLSIKLPTRQREWDVEVEYTVRVRRSIDATSYSNAVDELRETIENDFDDIEDIHYTFDTDTDYS